MAAVVTLVVVPLLIVYVCLQKYIVKGMTACAYDGKEGLTTIQEKKPDIIFSDISMPGLDGLKMIAALKSEFPDMQISILTGYRDFDYCQEAIRLGLVAEKTYVSQWHLSKLLNKHKNRNFPKY